MDVLRELLLPRLELGRKSGETWMAKCPAHADREASLAIRRGDKHPVVMTCHAGCERADILAAIGLTWDEMCSPRDAQSARGEWTPNGDAVAVYDYTDEAGNLLYQVLRTADKKFSQRVPDPSRKSGYRWSLEDTRRTLYRLPKIVEALREGQMVYITEGEKDVHAIERAGGVATCNSGGAGKWQPSFAEYFRDAIVRIVADKDKPGQAHARQVAATLDGVATAVEIVEAVTGKDAADHLEAGHALADFIITRQAGEIDASDLAQDLYDFLSEVDPAEDWVIPGLLERGDRLIWTGREGLGKSVATRQIAVAAAAGLHPFRDTIYPPRSVLFIDCENPKRKSRRRFKELENVARFKRRPIPKGGFRIIHRPEAMDLSRPDEVAWLIERVTAHKPDLLVIGPLYKLHALDVNDELAARAIVGALDQARVRADCALLIEAHAPHAEGDRSRVLRPVGSSLFMRWPEFGYGIREAPPAKGERPSRKRVLVQAWRGPREERDWPRALQWGREGVDWPWVPLDLDDLSGDSGLRLVADSA